MNRRLEELRRGIENLVTFLGLPSGATLHQLRQAAYYAAMTYHRHEFDALPYLALRGVKGVGRSALLKALGLFCYDAVAIDIASETPATLKEKLVQTESGTVLLDGHGDSKTRDVVEAYLKGRYTRPSAEASGMGPASEGQLTERQSLTLGATVVHLADRFEDQGLGLRGVWLTLQMNESRHGNDYQDIPESLVSIGRESLSSTMGFEFPRMPAPKGIPGRISEAYIPFLRMAHVVDDGDFIRELEIEMRLVDASLREGESYTQKGLVLKALIGCLAAGSGEDLDLGRSVAVDREICRYMQHHFMRSIGPRTAARHLRELGFEVRIVGGHTKVLDMTLPQLARACREAVVNDELVARKIAKVSPDYRGDAGL